MYSPVHASAGLFIALATPHPGVGIPLAVFSHYLLDAVPHGDTDLGSWMTFNKGARRIVIVESFDLGTAALMISYLVYMNPEKSPWYLVGGAIAGILPDLLWGLRFVLDRLGWFRWLTRILHVHDQFHSWRHVKREHDIPFRTGLLIQGLLLAAVLLLYR